MKRGCYQGDRHGNCDVGDFHLEEDQSPQRHPLRRHDRGSSSFALLDMIEDVVSLYIFLGPASPQQVWLLMLCFLSYDLCLLCFLRQLVFDSNKTLESI